eukprot:CAMPEP_0184694358 /NCGR_PEP_ID=MMETSP0313-20130426/2361_1 /TAXON_ID=2792 /ORGANISM="Porphyridium aerugineum, Strain SAG 1380-2" /LENGTH=358 /DNA_ID=CAMNT_0027152649 /DNA_START=136 /DNA_END=1212 /DNA_ORIENTATION=-
MDRATKFRFTSKANKQEIQTYRWDPPNPRNAVAVIYLIHGIHAHTGFEFLTYNPESKVRDAYKDSVVESYNNMGIIVCASDHVGHGLSTGLPAFFNMSDLTNDVKQHIQEQEWRDSQLKYLPHYLQGTSMGGLVTLLVASEMQDKLAGLILVSPAVVPPADLFGWYGKLLKTFSWLLSLLLPKLAVIQLPTTPFENLALEFYGDPLTYHGKLRCRPGREMLVSYDTIHKRKQLITVPCIIFSGSLDTQVNPEGIKRFYDEIPSKDKELNTMEGLWHDLLHEPNGEVVRQKIYTWLYKRVPGIIKQEVKKSFKFEDYLPEEPEDPYVDGEEGEYAEDTQNADGEAEQNAEGEQAYDDNQ